MKFNNNLKKILAYDPGKPIEFVVRKYGIDENKIIKLASNENPYGVSKKVKNKVKENIDKMYLYPDDSMYELKKVLADKFKVESKNIIIGSGSDQVIDMISRSVLNRKTKILTTANTFPMYDITAKLSGAKIIKTKSFRHDVDEILMLYKKEKPKIIYLCTPNNPTGDAMLKKDVIKIIKSVDENTVIVIDGAYMEYAKYKNDKYFINPSELLKYSNVIYLGTLSKAYGLAGMRVGYGISGENIMKQLYKTKPPFNISTISMIAAIEVLKDDKFMLNSLKKNFDEMSRYEKFAKKNNIDFIESSTNFITYFFDKFSSQKISEELLKKGIIIRDLMSAFNMNAIRITIGSKKQNTRFFKEFKIIIKNIKKENEII